MDALSEILKSIKLHHSAVGSLRLSAPWGLYNDDFDAPTAYGLVDGPPCWLCLPGQPPVRLEQGDIVLFAMGRYSLSSSADGPCTHFSEAWKANGLPDFEPDQEPESPLLLEWGGGGPVTRLLGLAFGLPSWHRNPLLAALPGMIVVRNGQSGAFPWVALAVEFLSARDANAPGFAATARVLAELMFLSTLRTHLLNGSGAIRGWLRGLTDTGIACALKAIHAKPGIKWTVASLAQTAGLSRTIFATRFAELVEVSPIEYLSQWRMHLAAESILQSRPNLTQLAFELGYASDAAFRDAFKRRYGVPPSRYAEHSDVMDGPST
ncbi:AraC family transcriptional regulator [Azospirillum sp. B506]|uniref:AraC family transcriptional regulator n=1 Tax=Azospirillum sp. B506 TaxID=137721 RepID=UPI0003483EB6|nr:AraC family transcriptional regulator [Azospirillum sp. B506]